MNRRWWVVRDRATGLYLFDTCAGGNFTDKPEDAIPFDSESSAQLTINSFLQDNDVTPEEGTLEIVPIEEGTEAGRAE